MIADRDVVHALADRLDHARALMTEHGRRVARRVGAGRRVHVRVADAGGDEPHEHLARLRILQVDLLDDERGSELLQHSGAHLGHVREPIAMWVLFDLNGTLVDPAVLLDPPELPIAALDEANMMAMVTVIAGAQAEFRTLLGAALERGLVRAGPRSRRSLARRSTGSRTCRPTRTSLKRFSSCATAAAGSPCSRSRRPRRRRPCSPTRASASTSSTCSPRRSPRAFKPEDLAYHGALEKLGATEAWFVAGHWWDVAGAAYAGLKTAWVSRTDLAYPLAMPAPDVQGADIQAIAKAILAKVGT